MKLLRIALAFLVASFLAFPGQAATDPLGSSFLPAIDTNSAHYPSNVWITDQMQKVRQDAGSPGSNKWGTFYGTQNETVSFQVHYHDTGSGTTGLAVSVGNLTQSSPAVAMILGSSTNISCHREYYYNITTKSATGVTYYNSTGVYPDGLIPTIDPYHGQTTNAFPVNVAANANQSAWCEVHIPSNAPAGYYLGSVTVKVNGTTLTTMPIILAVWQWFPVGGFMPSTSSLPFQTRQYFSDFCTQVYGAFNQCHNYPASTGSDQTAATLINVDLGKLLLDHRIGAANYFDPQYTSSFSGLEANYGPLLNGTANTILQGAKLNSVEYTGSDFANPTTTTNLQFWATEFQSKGWSAALFGYNCDEPPGSCGSSINSKTTNYHGTTPAIPSLVTTNLATATTNSWLNGIDIMVVKINDLDPIGGSLQRSTYNAWLGGSSGGVKRQIGSYQSCSSGGYCGPGLGTGPSTATWPNLAIDGKPGANRVMETLTFLHNQTFELYYAVTDCFTDTNCTDGTNTDKPWISLYAYGNNGDGTLALPGDSTHVGSGVTTPIWIPTMRLKYIRDGMQDYEYYKLLTANGKGALVTAQINTFVTNSYTFEPTGAGLMAARMVLGNAMHALSYSGGSTPPPPCIAH